MYQSLRLEGRIHRNGRVEAEQGLGPLQSPAERRAVQLWHPGVVWGVGVGGNLAGEQCCDPNKVEWQVDTGLWEEESGLTGSRHLGYSCSRNQ